MQDWYYVKGGRQLGPVSFEELRTLANHGSLLPDDLVWHSSMQDWAPAQTVAGIFPSANPALAPQSPLSAATTPAWTEIAPGSNPIEIGTCIERAFKLTVRHIGLLILILLILIAINFAVGAIMGILDQVFGLPGAFSSLLRDIQSRISPGSAVTIQDNEASLLNLIVTNLVSTFLSLGTIRIGLNIVDSREFSVGQLFGGSPYFLRAILAALLWTVGIMTIAGIGILPLVFLHPLMPQAAFVSLCIGMGALLSVGLIHLSLRFGFHTVAIVDRNLGVIDAFRYSSHVTTGNRLRMLVLVILGAFILLAGILAFCVGIFFTYPLAALSWMVAYRWMQYGAQVAQEPAARNGA